MTKNWPAFFQQNIQSPRTVVKAVDRLMMILDDKHKITIAIMPEEDLIDLHVDLGMAIRNAFGLYEPG